MQTPCIVDLKLGFDVKEKLKEKLKTSTSYSTGLRVHGMQVLIHFLTEFSILMTKTNKFTQINTFVVNLLKKNLKQNYLNFL